MIHQFDGFEVIEKLGEGGMASVWKARQVSLDRTVAIKVLSNRFMEEPDDIRRFQEEAQSAAKLKHPGIVQVYDANAEQGVYYFIMEYVAGYTVGDWVRRKGVLSEQDALSVAECVADALSYAWNHAGIIHCDIKPDNVIIDADGTVKVADLGLARTISAMGQDADAEQESEIMGTPAYIAPEQAQGSPDLDFRADIYALGAMLYHLVTGKMMFQGCDENETMERQISDTVEDPLDVNPKLSKGLGWLVERMTAKDPDLREDSWDAVRDDIVRVRRGLLPQGKVLPDGASTVRRSARRTVSDFQRVARLQEATKLAASDVVRTTIVIAVIAVLLAFGVRLYIAESQVPLLPPPVSPTVVTNVITVTKPPVAGGVAESENTANVDRERRMLEMYDVADNWCRENPDDFAGGIAQYEAVMRQTRGSKYGLLARQQVRDLKQRQSKAIREVLDSLRAEVAPFVKANEFGRAIGLVSGYTGAFADESDKKRKRLVLELEGQQRAWETLQQREAERLIQSRQKSIESLVQVLLSDDFPLAISHVTAMLTDKAFQDEVSELREVLEVLKKAADIDGVILGSFRAQRGETIDVMLSAGMRTLTIGAVKGNVVECREALSLVRGGIRKYDIGVASLATREKLLRMGSDALPEVALVKGVMAFNAKAYDHAEKYVGATHPWLSEKLLKSVGGNRAPGPRAAE
jgi:hypothetical protein